MQLDSNGSVVVKYVYDAWGKCKVLNTSGVEITDDTHIGILNPFRYRSYYYDHGIGLYFLKTRYYDPEIARFITIDDISYLDPDIVNGLNLYAYCRNNPVMRYDPVGTFDWEMLWDTLITAFSIVSGIAVGLATGLAVVNSGAMFWGPVGGFIVGAIAGAATTGLINNAVNFVYYTWISDGVSDLTPSSYNVANSGSRYINRWDRLDYAKQETGQSHYNFNAWMYYSEYNFHMHIWNLTWWAKDKDVFLFSSLANSASVAAVDSTDPFSDYNYYMERNQPIMAILRTIAYMATGMLGI